jgi:hypothetical protein
MHRLKLLKSIELSIPTSYQNHFHLTINIVEFEILVMAKYDGIKGQELLDVEEKKDELTLIFKDNRYLFIKIENGKLVSDSVPE